MSSEPSRDAPPRVTGDDVARHAGVSRAVVSRVLNDRPHRFPPETVARVRAAVEALGYRPSAAGRALATGSSDLVVAVIPRTTLGATLQTVFETVTDRLAAAGYALVIRLAQSSSDSFEHLVAGMRPAAVLDLGALRSRDRERLEPLGIRYINVATGGASATNDRIGALQGDRLAARGLDRFAYAHLRDDRDDVYGDRRAAAFARAVHAEVAEIFVSLDEEDALRQLAAVGVLDAVRGGERVGVACFSDDVALAILAACRRAGLDVPRHVAIVGSDATPAGQLTMPRLTTVAIDYAATAEVLSNMILARLAGRAVELQGMEESFRLVPGDSD